MGNIIDFNIATQYKFLYIRGQDKDLVYHVWGKTSRELEIVTNLLKKRNKSEYCIWMSSGSRIRKEFAPVPNYTNKQQDNYYHGYVMIGGGINE